MRAAKEKRIDMEQVKESGQELHLIDGQCAQNHCKAERQHGQVLTGTIRQIHKALKDDGFAISEWWLRERVRIGEIPALTSGTRAIISYDVAREYIENKLYGR